jgi:Flp pilus assembly protein TadD
VADTATDAPVAVELQKMAEATPSSESLEVADSVAVAETLVAAESIAVAKPSATTVPPAKTTITRHQTGDEAMSGIVAMGLAAMRSNDLRTAERLFREALVADSGDVATWSYLYGVLYRASKPAEAEQALQRGLVTADEPAALAKLYAQMLMDRRDKDAAISILKIHRPAPASDTEYDAFLAALLQQQGRYAEAGEIYQNLLAVEPDSGSVWIGLAMSSDSLGDRADARSAFERALGTGSLKTPLARYARRRVEELMAYD